VEFDLLIDWFETCDWPDCPCRQEQLWLAECIPFAHSGQRVGIAILYSIYNISTSTPRIVPFDLFGSPVIYVVFFFRKANALRVCSNLQGRVSSTLSRPQLLLFHPSPLNARARFHAPIIQSLTPTPLY